MKYINKHENKNILIQDINTIDELISIKDNSKLNINININSNISLIVDILEDLNDTICINYICNEDDIINEFIKRNTYQGFNRSILNKVKQICSNVLNNSDLVVDMTVGNGNDTLYLSTLVPNGHVFGFDIQIKAIENTKQLLDSNNITNYTLFNLSHENVYKVLNKYNIKLILFNLGYLPKGDKTIMTNHKSTLNAFIESYKLVALKGVILMVFYPHPEGLLEAKTIINYLNKEKIYYEEYHNTSNNNAPFLVVIPKG